MKITKKQIEFFNSYISTEPTRKIFQNLYLDMSTVNEEKEDGEVRRTARVCATNGFVFGSIEVELDEEDIVSFLIPYEHLLVAKHYLKTSRDFIQITYFAVGSIVEYRIGEVTITTNTKELQSSDFPRYEHIVKENEPEYTIKVNAKLLKEIAVSHLKLGQEHVLIKMIGDDKPVNFKGFDQNIISVLMPLRSFDDSEKGKLQK